MTLIEAMEQAENGNVIQRKYHVQDAGTFTKSGRMKITETGRFFEHKWGNIKLDDLKADNWEVAR